MFKKWVVLIACFFSGILICGLGVGIGFVEFSGMTYIGEQEIGEQIEETLIYVITDEADSYYIYSHFHIPPGQKIISDNSIPKDQIKIDVTYNSMLEKPYIYDDYYHSHEETSIVTYDENGNEIFEDDVENSKSICDIYISYPDGAMESLLKAKDIILEDLKNNRIGSYRVTDDFDVVVRCNPAIADKIIVR